MGFFVYASALVGRAARPPHAYGWLAGIVLLIAIEWLLLDLSNFVLLIGGALSSLIGTVNINFSELERHDAALRLSQAEVRWLAAVAERERIARDLHDLLGHTLSLVTIKAALAARLAALGDSRAEQEPGRGRRVRRWHRGGAAPFARNGPELPVRSDQQARCLQPGRSGVHRPAARLALS